VTSPTDPHESNFEHASSRLDEGLRSCRAVLSNYRSLLAGDGNEESGQSPFAEPARLDEPRAN